MSVSFLSRLSTKNAFIVLASIAAATICLFREQIFTGESFAETVVLICAGLYLVIKYQVSKTILRYQKGGYSPSKGIRRRDDILVGMAVHIVLPICTDLIYACTFLALLKYLPIFNTRDAANFIYTIYDFNKEHIKFPLFIAGTIIAVLTLFRWLSEKYYKRYKKALKLVTNPLKVIAILLLFINVDDGSQNNNILYAIRKEPVKKEEKKTFNVSKEDKEKVQQAAQAFADDVVSGIRDVAQILGDDASEDDAGFRDDPASAEFLRITKDHTDRIFEERPDLKNSFTNLRSNYSDEEKVTLRAVFTSAPAVATDQPEFQATNLSNKVFTRRSADLGDLVSILNDEKESIREETESTSKKILKGFLGDFLGKVCLLDKLPEAAHFPGLFDSPIFKEKAFDLVKEKLRDGLFYLISCKTFSATNVKAVVRAVRVSAEKAIKACLYLAQQKAALLKRYYCDLQDVFVHSATEAYDAARPTNNITYEEGLRIKKEMLESSLTGDVRQRTEDDIREALRRKYPELEGELLEENVRDNFERYAAKVRNDINEQDQTIASKMYKNFDFVKDQFTSGGIFFGRSIDKSGPQNRRIKLADYYPRLEATSYITPTAVWVESRNGGLLLFVQGQDGVYQYGEPLDTALFVSAYRFVFGEDSYPSLIDMFHREDNGKIVKIPAYHKAFVHNDEVKSLFNEADQFIFNVLDFKINSPLLERVMGPSRQAYRLEQDSFAIHQGYSRLFDSSHVLTLEKPGYCVVHSDIFFSVIQTMPREKVRGKDSRYKEISSVSNGFNESKAQLIDSYQDLQRINRFAGYQALLRTVKRSNTDVFELFRP